MVAKALTRLLLGVLLGCGLGVAGVVFSVWYVARQDDRQSADTIVVLGSAQYNGVPSANFKARLQHALDLYDEGWAKHIVTVGGNRAGDNYTEAAAGRTWLIAQGAPADAVTAVETGSNTLQSAVAVGKLCVQKKWATAIVVTDPWHTLRSEQMIGEQGITTYGSPTRSGPSVQTRSTQIRYIIRESAAILYYGVTGNNSDGAQEHG